MTPPEITLLLHRLLWPAWQVRWEAARQLAGLIARGDKAAAEGLLAWTAERRLESEAIMGLSLIEAFGLSAHFDGAAVASAVMAPSHLSDLLLKRLFGIEPAGIYGFANGPAEVDDHVAAYFEKKMGQAVPLSFQSTFARLEERSGLPFLARWEYEWRWLQAHLGEPLSSQPYWFSWEDSQGVGHFDLRQREVYLSAFLRTLAFAAADEWLPDAIAEHFAVEVCVLDSGLAQLAFRERPGWTQGLATSPLPDEELADVIWKSAQYELAEGRMLLSARAVDISKRAFIEVEIDLVAGDGDWSLGEAEEGWSPLERTWLRMRRPQGGLRGAFARQPPSAVGARPLTVVATPGEFARWHSDLFPEHLLVASPTIFDGEVLVEPRADGLGLALKSADVSDTFLWNASWAPIRPRDLRSRIGRVTDGRSADVEAFLARQGLRVRRLAFIRVGRRKSDHSEFEVEHQVMWLDPEVGVGQP